MKTQDDNEGARYLASYIVSNQDRVLDYSFDRNGSHNAGVYKESVYIDYDSLHEVIREFYANLL